MTSSSAHDVHPAARILPGADMPATCCPMHAGMAASCLQGMGEPLANLPAVAPALDILTSQPGLQISPARVTVSTSGLVPQVRSRPGHTLSLPGRLHDEVELPGL